MKYPQLVSTRAVSAISDWLVTQLEQLGVDASSVYSRLLLSLLHTPLQINALDLAELSDHKVTSIGRNKSTTQKGGNNKNHRRFSAADTDALKRLEAIDSLLKAVSSDQQLSKIETLVDELSSKLRAIEEQNALDDSSAEISDSVDSVHNDSHSDSLKKASATPEDPAKRYFRAFPALSGQSAHGFNQKKAPWPRTDIAPSANELNQQCKQVDDQPKEAITSMETVNAQKKKSKRKRSTGTDPAMASSTAAPNPTATSSKTTARVMKASAHGKTANAISATVNAAAKTAAAGKSHTKKKAADIWDTDFDGAWEMGRDLFREFVMKQNNRNRSISESEAIQMASLSDASSKLYVPNGIVHIDNDVGSNSEEKCGAFSADEENLRRTAAAAAAVLLGDHIDNIAYLPDSGTFSASSTVTDSSMLGVGNAEKMMIRSEGYSTPDTLASWNEQEAVYSLAPRRLYERDVSTESINCAGVTKIDVEYGSDCVDSGCDENVHLAAFEAKFDQNVEALWNDCKTEDAPTMNGFNAQPMHSIWFNYYRNAIDNQPSQMYANETVPEFTAINQMAIASLNAPPLANQRNVFNMDSNAATKPSGLGLMNSIWADNPSNQEDDVSFYASAKLWGESQKALKQPNNFSSIDYEPMARTNTSNRGASNVGTTTTTSATASDIGNYENATLFKWSDGASEMSFAPIQAEPCTGPPPKQENKIRRNLFGNSYFDPYQSHQVMADNNCGLDMATPDEPHSTEHSFGHMQTNTMERVTLANHSSTSCFKVVKPLPFEAKQEILRNNESRQYQAAAAALDTSTEDLLTSERSRFRPIRQSYVDGYTFKINSDLDKIDYERSPSGTMFYDSEVYREYSSYDDEDGGANRVDESGSDQTNIDFVIKYAIRQNDMACQTDDIPPPIFGAPSAMSPLLHANRLQSFSSLNSQKSVSLGQRLISFNSGVINQPQFVSMQRGNDDNDLDNDSMDQMIDLKECYANLKGWSMADNNRCCNNNNNAHALWEHCSTCSNDMISVPANRLLKDELCADGDEIMSDLKDLQDLYIGSDWEDADDSDMVVEYEDDVDHLATIQPKLSDVEQKEEISLDLSTENDDLSNDPIYSNVNKLISDLLQPEKAKTLVQAVGEKCQNQLGRILSDDHAIEQSSRKVNKPNDYNTKDIQFSKNGASCNSSSMVANESNSHFGSLWVYNGNSIWHKDKSADDDVWPNAIYSDKNVLNVKHSDERSMMKMADHWEHANLEKIWKSETPSNAIDSDAKSNDLLLSGSSQGATPTNFGNESTKAMDNPNSLEKFMELIKQANANSQPIEAPHNHQCASDDLHKSLQSRTDRKRRHSATSQNCFDQFNYPLANCEAIDTTKKLATKTVNEYDERNIFECNENDANPTTTTTTAIITCKYWSENDSFCLTSTLAFDNNNLNPNCEHILNCYHRQMQQQPSIEYEADNNMFDTLNSSDPLNMYPFLKQVAAMVSRPLTR